jgi:hypothetical protein
MVLHPSMVRVLRDVLVDLPGCTYGGPGTHLEPELDVLEAAQRGDFHSHLFKLGS